jgi:transposase InsO family protein
MTAEKRQTSTVEFKREAVRLVTVHGYGVAEAAVWAGDITYVWTAEGWWHLAVLLDWYSRKVVGWAMSHRVEVA